MNRMTCRAFIITMLVTFGPAPGVYGQDLEVTCQADKDTASVNGPIIVKVRLKNVSENMMRLPEGFHVTSSVLPNGLDFPQEGIRLHFDIHPAPPEAKIVVEGLTVIVPNKFYKIKAGRAVEFNVDLGRHINYVNESLREEEISFPLHHLYSFTCYVSNRWTSKHSEESGRFKDIRAANDARVYVIP